MAEMYLDPEIEVMWAQAGQGIPQPALQPNLEAVHAAQTLLAAVSVTEDIALRHQVQSKHCKPLTPQCNRSSGMQGCHCNIAHYAACQAC